MADGLSQEERAAIAAFTGPVEQIPRGQTAEVLRWCAKDNRLRYVDKAVGEQLKRGPKKRYVMPPQIRARRAQVALLCDQGMDIDQMLAAMGDAMPSEATLRNDLRKLGRAVGDRIQAKIAARRERVRVLIGKGLHPEEIAAHPDVQVSRAIVYGDASALGLTFRAPPRKSGPPRSRPAGEAIRARRERVRALVDQGHAHRAIADHLGASVGTIAGDVAALRRSGALDPSAIVRGAAVTERRAKVAEMVRAGATARAVAAALGEGLHVIRFDLTVLRKSGGLPTKGTAAAAVEARRDEVVTLQPQGLTMVELAARFGVSRSAIANDLSILRAQGRLPRRTPLIDSHGAEVWRRHRAGETGMAIAKATGISTHTVATILAEGRA